MDDDTIPVPPEVWSFTSLAQVRTCPLQWQLRHARNGAKGSTRNPRALEGQIVHETLDSLFKILVRAGLPTVGSPEFAEAILSFAPHQVVAARTRAEDLKGLQRGFVPLRWTKSTQGLINDVVLLLRQQYAPSDEMRASLVRASTAALAPVVDLGTELKKQGFLSEIELRHPALALKGTLDLVALRGGATVVVDFKTGNAAEEHARQVLLYSLLWWRVTGEVPARAELVYPNGMTAVAVSAAELAQLERDLVTEMRAFTDSLGQVAEARKGPHCRYCAPRGQCDAYWNPPPVTSSGIVDVEFVPAGPRGFASLPVRLEGGAGATLVFAPGSPTIAGLPVEATRVRALGLVKRAKDVYEVTSYTGLHIVEGGR
jgi:CRISPR/Cas system-associated exonuclease Cas4 (RecB family)